MAPTIYLDMVSNYFSPQLEVGPVTELKQLDTRALDRFLAEVEHRVFRTVLFAVKNEEDALDIIQDAMMKFVVGYQDKATTEWPLLFHRIVQNCVKDFFRRQKVRNRWTLLFSQLTPTQYQDNADEIDPLELIADEHSKDGEQQLASEQRISQAEKLVANLPLRQQQAFLLRCWEGLDTRDTALAMGCSEGSVKTHYFRALEHIKRGLENY
jgi:RNA polymerase sigma-70 factor, ECF subfamily